jgi:hypothetical protein
VVPVRQFSTKVAGEPRPITPEHLDYLDPYQNQFIAPFDGQKGRRQWLGQLKSGERRVFGTDDTAMSWEELGVRNVTWLGEDRSKRIENARPTGLVFIDGELHEVVSEEPKLRCIFYPYEVNIGVCLEARVLPSQVEYFKLDRLEDCLEHAKTVAPGLPLFVGVRDLVVHDCDVLEYADENENLMRLAWSTHLHLSKLGTHLNEEPDVLGVFFKMRKIDMSQWTTDTTEAAADCLDALSRMHVEKFGLDPKKLSNALRRWEMRPVDMALAPGR